MPNPRLDTQRLVARGNNYIFLRFFVAVGFFAESVGNKQSGGIARPQTDQHI